MSSRAESLAIPDGVRDGVDERDGGHCRLCGQQCGDRRVHHHVHYGGSDRGMGGRRRHRVEEIVTLCNPCHGLAHANKHKWQPVLDELTRRTGVTGLQLLRWSPQR